MNTLIVVAKQCLPGRVKTRLTPALSPERAAEVAGLMLRLTLAAAARTSADRQILFFDGEQPPAEAAGWDVVRQPAGTLDVRLGAIFDAVRGRSVLIGMDTPQFDPGIIDGVFADDSGANAWFGGAPDGGFWALGFDRPRGRHVRGVPMSRTDTGAQQLERLRRARLRVGMLPEVADVDTIDDVVRLAGEMPQFASGAAHLLQNAVAS